MNTNIINKIAQYKAELQSKLELLDKNDLTQLLEERQQLLDKVTAIDDKIAHICQELGIDNQTSAPTPKKTRTRLSTAEIQDRITNILKNNPQGVGLKQLSDDSGVAYPSVINFVKNNEALLRSEGERRSKKIFLK
jgi:arsenate reductase-like glutaredoxin family protein